MSQSLPVFSPLVLPTDLFLLLGGEVILDVEGLSDLLGRLSLDHVGDGLTANIQELLDVEIVGSEDDLEEHLLIDIHELLIPLLDLGGLAAGVGFVAVGDGFVVLVVFAPLNDLAQDRLVDVWDGDIFGGGAFGTEVVKHVFDQKGSFGGDTGCEDCISECAQNSGSG